MACEAFVATNIALNKDALQGESLGVAQWNWNYDHACMRVVCKSYPKVFFNHSVTICETLSSAPT